MCLAETRRVGITPCECQTSPVQVWTFREPASSILELPHSVLTETVHQNNHIRTLQLEDQKLESFLMRV